MARQPATPALLPLTDSDIDQLRHRLGAGETPRVVIRSASAAFASGTRGNVVRLGDPSQDEYVVVRVKRDEVPFSPSELALPGRSSATTAIVNAPKPSPPASKQAEPKRVAPTSRPRKRAVAAKSPAPISVNLRFAAGEWKVEAMRGARRVAKATPLRPGAVSALAEHIDDETLRAALVETVEACRAVAAAKAADLRAQLDDIEAALRDYEIRPRRSRSQGV